MHHETAPSKKITRAHLFPGILWRESHDTWGHHQQQQEYSVSLSSVYKGEVRSEWWSGWAKRCCCSSQWESWGTVTCLSHPSPPPTPTHLKAAWPLLCRQGHSHSCYLSFCFLPLLSISFCFFRLPVPSLYQILFPSSSCPFSLSHFISFVMLSFQSISCLLHASCPFSPSPPWS